MSLQFLPKAQFDLLFKNSKDFVYFMEKVGEDYRYIYLNNSSTQLLSGDVIGKTITEVMNESHYQVIIDHYHLATQRQEQVSYQDYCYFLSEVKKYETTVIPIFESEQTYILAITKEIAFDRDIEDKFLFMRSIFFNTFLSTVIISDDGKLLEANPRFLEDFDLEIEEVRLKYVFELPLISNYTSEQVSHFLNEAYKGKSLTSKLLTFVDKDGNIRSFTATLTPILQSNNANKVAAVFVILQEITQFIQQEKELRTTSLGLSNFKYALNSATEISVTDPNGIIIDVNDRFEEQTGYTRDELIGNTYALINSRIHSKEFFDNLWDTIRRGDIWRGEIQNLTKYGVPYWADTTIIPLLDEEGDIQQYFSVHFNISEKKRMLTELRNIDHMFKLITDNTNDLIVITNEDGIILYASSAYKRRLGFEKEELLGQFYSKLLSSESKEIWNNTMFGIENKMNSKIELIHKSKDGNSLWTECNYTVVPDYSRNRGRQIIMVAREITERKEIENQLLFLAFHDSLTQLPNRRYIQKEFPLLIEVANSSLQSIAVLYVDGDNFKEVNDQFGHEVGDFFISEFGDALTRSVRGNDLVIRIGGDEFAIILTGLVRNEQKRNDQVIQIVERINENLQKGWIISGHLFTPTASIGIAFYPDHGSDLNMLLERSDEALYEIKQASKNNFKIYQEQ